MEIVFVFYILIDITSSVCPDSSLLMPCICHNDHITCEGYEDIDLVKIFRKFERELPRTQEARHFRQFILTNTFITELKENTFSNITFNEIYIHFCENLFSIHENAFLNTDLYTTHVSILKTPKLTSPDNSLFKALSKFVNAEEIYVDNTNITEIPSNAFVNDVGYQDKCLILKYSLIFFNIPINRLF